MKENPCEKIIRLLGWLIVDKHNERIKEFPVEEKTLWKLPDVSDLFKNRRANREDCVN